MSLCKKKAFNFRRFKQRHIALKILYFGWDYGGIAEQLDYDNTIEHHLFKALTTTCLIESRQTCNYNRCGRTDKGVSSYGQVVNLDIRSNLVDERDPQNFGLFTPVDYICGQDDNCDKQRQEIPYVDALNRVLPEQIRILAWAPVGRDFSSRFDCLSRSYSYIFPRGDLKIDLMQKSLTYLVGEHDFRNLCSFDLKNGVTNHIRTILDAKVAPIRCIEDKEEQDTNQYSFCEVVIVGKAFLYHQIRCIMTVIFLVGSGKESPEIVRDLLNTDECNAKPNYNRASASPLSLFDCQYPSEKMPLGWKYNLTSIYNVYKKLKQLWLDYKTKSMMIERVLMDLETKHLVGEIGELPNGIKTDSWKDFGLTFDTMNHTKYVPLLKRSRDDSLEAKLETLKAKRQKRTDDSGC